MSISVYFAAPNDPNAGPNPVQVTWGDDPLPQLGHYVEWGFTNFTPGVYRAVTVLWKLGTPLRVFFTLEFVSPL